MMARPWDAGASGEQDYRDLEGVGIGDSWLERDLGDVVDGLEAGTIERPTPTIGWRTDMACLFYAGRVNSLFGESGDGKTFVAQAVVCQELGEGHHVMWIDYEDNEIGTVGRLLDLGATSEQIKTQFHYFTPSEPFGLVAKAAFAEIVTQLDSRITLVVIDSVGEAMSIDGTKPNDDDSVAKWMRTVCRWIADLGPGVAFIDHTPKHRDNPLFPAGSFRKRAAVTGSAFLVESIRAFGIGREGRSKLTCAKDRLGNYVRGQKVAEFILDGTAIPHTFEIVPPENAGDNQDGFRPTRLMEKVSRFLEVHPHASKGEIDAAKLGRAEYVRQATDLLIAEAYIKAEQDGRAIRHQVVTAFREDEQ
jgi:AAA domain